MFSKSAKWIGQPGVCAGSWYAKVLPAPFFRKDFDCAGKKVKAEVAISGVGYYELYLNGRKVEDHVLDPVVSQYDKRVRYVVYDVSKLLVPGKNVLGVVLGNGWFNCHTPEVWHFDKASWRNYPEMLLQLKINGKLAVVSDESWKFAAGPIVFDGLRNGEIYDARLELGDWCSANYDDGKWTPCASVNPPGGLLAEQFMPPCKVMETLAAVSCKEIGSKKVYDFGQNISGWCRIKVSGKAGAEVRIAYGERLAEDGSVDQSHIGLFIKGDHPCQTDTYILKGSGEEVWEPRFTYHGFQYAQVTITGEATLSQIEARFVYTSFKQVGRFECSDENLNKLQACTLRSYKANFVGIPTDCPHREKNGWTGDAQLASETGLCNFDPSKAYAQWLESFADVQRPDGQLPGIVPSAGWGFNWGSGPAWDSAFLIIAWHTYLYTGDATAIKAHYESMKRYVDYCTYRADNHIVSFGLGDWCHPEQDKPEGWRKMAETAITSTGYYYLDVKLLSKFAELTGRKADAKAYAKLAETIKKAFNKRFYKGDGVYGKGEITELACPLYHGMVEDKERAKVLKRLVEAVEAKGCKAEFGILGAQYIPRVLAENGYEGLALRILTQPELPGWVYWLKQGATALRESWHSNSSLNHIMFGDVSAWMYNYLAGIKPDPKSAGFKHIQLKPFFAEGLEWVKAERQLPKGKLSVAWKRNAKGTVKLSIEIPAGSTATLQLPGEKSRKLSAGKHTFEK